MIDIEHVHQHYAAHLFKCSDDQDETYLLFQQGAADIYFKLLWESEDACGSETETSLWFCKYFIIITCKKRLIKYITESLIHHWKELLMKLYIQN